MVIVTVRYGNNKIVYVSSNFDVPVEKWTWGPIFFSNDPNSSADIQIFAMKYLDKIIANKINCLTGPDI